MNFAFLKEKLPSLPWLSLRRDARHRLGARGEREAARYLRRMRYRVLARNYVCPMGEIDLICRDRAAIVFVEVKTRRQLSSDDPRDAAQPVQWQRIERVAKFFLQTCVLSQPPCRFDLVTVEWPATGRPRVEHMENVFQPAFR